jgi:type IV pilus assembly protein PilC
MRQYFKSEELSFFAGNMAMMIKAGITPTDAVSRLLAHPGDDIMRGTLDKIFKSLEEDRSDFATAVKNTDMFPEYMVNMIAVGEESGRLEEVLKSLSDYYGRQSHLEKELRTALIYPSVLLFLMGGVLLLMTEMVLPVFTKVYNSMTGSLAASSYAYVDAAVIIGKAGLYITLIACVIMIIFFIMSNTRSGSEKLLKIGEKFPMTRKIMYQISLSQLADFLETFIASGLDEDTSVERGVKMVTNRELSCKLKKVQNRMKNGENLSDAFSHEAMFDTAKSVMLITGAGLGKTEEVLSQLADSTGYEAENSIQSFIEIIEPVFTGFLTIVIGVTLLSIMLPLIGMLGAIG